LIHITKSLNLSKSNPNISEIIDEEIPNPWGNANDEQNVLGVKLDVDNSIKEDDISEDSSDSFDKPIHSHLNLTQTTTSDSIQPTKRLNHDKRAHLLFCKSHVYIHPTPHNKDNIDGILGIAEVTTAASSHSMVSGDEKGKGKGKGKKSSGKKVVLFWIPISLAWELGEEERYKMWEGRMVEKDGLEGMSDGVGRMGGKEVGEGKDDDDDGMFSLQAL
jgi:hypothetical protein